MQNKKCLGFVLVFSEEKQHIETIFERLHPPAPPHGVGGARGIKLSDI